MFQVTTAQDKKNATSKTSNNTGARKLATPQKAAVKKTATSKTVPNKQESPQKAVVKKQSSSETVSKKQVSPKRVTSNKLDNSEAVNEGDLIANAGIGVLGFGIPIYIGADYGIGNDITIGGEATYQKFNVFGLNSNNIPTIIGIGATGNYHFGRILKIPNQWDIYSGVGLGYMVWTYPNNNNFGGNSSGVVFGMQIGARYYFGQKFAVNAQVGGISTLSILRFGVSYKF